MNDLNDSREELNRLRAQQLQMQMMHGVKDDRVKLAQDRLVQTVLHDSPRQVYQDIPGSMWQGKADVIGQTMLAGRPDQFVQKPIATALAGKALLKEVDDDANSLLSQINVGRVLDFDKDLREKIVNSYNQRLRDIQKQKLNPWEKRQAVKLLYNEFQNDHKIKDMYTNRDMYESYVKLIDENKDLNLTGDMKEKYKMMVYNNMVQKGGTGEGEKSNYVQTLNPSKVIDLQTELNKITDNWKADGQETKNGVAWIDGMWKKKSSNGQSWERVDESEVRGYAMQALLDNPEVMAHISQKTMMENYGRSDDDIRKQLYDQYANYVKNTKYSNEVKSQMLSKVERDLQSADRNQLLGKLNMDMVERSAQRAGAKASFLKTKMESDFDISDNGNYWKQMEMQEKRLAAVGAGPALSANVKAQDVSKQLKTANEVTADSNKNVRDFIRSKKATSTPFTFGQMVNDEGNIDAILNDKSARESFMATLTPIEKSKFIDMLNTHTKNVQQAANLNEKAELVINKFIEDQKAKDPNFNLNSDQVKSILQSEDRSWGEYLQNAFNPDLGARTVSNLAEGVKTKIKSDFNSFSTKINNIGESPSLAEIGKDHPSRKYIENLTSILENTSSQIRAFGSDEKANMQQIVSKQLGKDYTEAQVKKLFKDKKIHLNFTDAFDYTTNSPVMSLSITDDNKMTRTVLITVPGNDEQIMDNLKQVYSVSKQPEMFQTVLGKSLVENKPIELQQSLDLNNEVKINLKNGAYGGKLQKDSQTNQLYYVSPTGEAAKVQSITAFYQLVGKNVK